MRFGTGGVPISCPEGTSIGGIGCVAELGLDAFEFEFVHGCRMKESVAAECGAIAKEKNVSLSAHASYYLNLLSDEPSKHAKSVKEILTTAHVLNAAGGDRLVFHPGFFLEIPHSVAYERMRKEFKLLADAIRKDGLFVHLAPEVTGKPTAFGSIEDIYMLSEEIGYDAIRPTIDWAHVHARENGRIKGKADYVTVFEMIEKRVGKEGLKTLHCHMSSIHFSVKGELNHLTMDHDVPPFRPLVEAMRDFKCDGTIISESPNLEKDATYMKRVFEEKAKK